MLIGRGREGLGHELVVNELVALVGEVALVKRRGKARRRKARELLFHLLGIGFFYLLAHELTHIAHKRIVVHRREHIRILRIVFKHLLFDVGAGHAVKLLVDHTVYIRFGRIGHITDVQLRLFRIVYRRAVFLNSRLYLLARERLVGLLERKSRENVVLRVGKLLFDKLLFGGLLNDVFRERVCVADGAGHHSGHGIGTLAHYADYLELDTVCVERLESERVGAYVLIFARFGVKLPAVRREDEAEGLFADIGIAPAFEL